jgi:short-subunit dehydrogenase
MTYAAAGKRVLITGASSGVGAAPARRLAVRGAAVGLIARRAERLEEVLTDCRRSSPASAMWVADLADTAALDQLAVQAADALGGIDILVNNAAIPKRRMVAGLDAGEVETVMRVNFFAPMRLTLAILPRMLACGEGVIVNVSSVGGRLGIIHEAAYCASKFALCGWSESIAVDLHGTGVVVKLPKVPAGVVADGIIAALGSDRFEHYLPDMKAVVDAKNADLDVYIAGAAAALSTKAP